MYQYVNQAHLKCTFNNNSHRMEWGQVADGKQD